MMKLILAVLLGLSINIQAQGTRKMVITIDDLPFVSRIHREAAAWDTLSRHLLAAITQRKIPAIGFVNEGKLYDGSTLNQGKLSVLSLWLESGLELGNHTFSHPDLHRIPLEEFKTDLLEGEAITRGLSREFGQPYRFFRHPFLHTGMSLDIKTDLLDFLAAHRYREAPVTVDNSEWIYALAYDLSIAAGDSLLQSRISADYIRYMEAMTAYYEQQSRALFGYEIPQVLLIHANTLNSLHFGRLADMISARGYQFITLETALEDPAYQSEDSYVGRGGITWLHRWALTMGKKGTFFAGEPETPQFILDAAGMSEQ